MKNQYTIVSLFDGISCGREAIRQCKIADKNIKYYASEIDPVAIRVAQKRYPNITQIGDVCNISYKNGVIRTKSANYNVGKVHLLLAGSPCQGFSSNGNRKLLQDERSVLFFQFARLLKEIQPTYFLLENVRMPGDVENVITKRLCKYNTSLYRLNSRNWCAQNRDRLYWTNIPNDARFLTTAPHRSKQYAFIVPDIIKDGYDGIYHRPHGYYKGGFKEKQEKAPCITRCAWLSSFFVHQHGKRRKFTADECEELQTLPHHYTYDAGSDSARVSLIGNAWTVAVIRDLLYGAFHEPKKCSAKNVKMVTDTTKPTRKNKQRRKTKKTK